MHLLTKISPKLWALGGTGLVFTALALIGTTAFHHNSQHTVTRSVGMNLTENTLEYAVSAPPPLAARLAKFSPKDGAVSIPELQPQKLIRTARLGLEVKDFPRFEKACRGLAQRYGYLADLRINDEEGGRKRADLTLRIAAERFDSAIADFKSLGTVKKEEVSVEDVTRAYADLEARRANKCTAATRLREIIANRTGKLSEVIEAERALSEVTEELESMEAQKRTMDGQIHYSTLKADVTEPPLPQKINRPVLWEPMVTALKDGRTGLITSLAVALEIVIVLSPWLVVAALGFWALHRWRASRPKTEEVAVLS